MKAARRSQAWFGGQSKDAFIHRSWMKNHGYPEDLFDGRPVIGICNTFSELTPCNAHLRGLAEAVKRGVYEAGGFPLEFPVFSCGESNLRPTAMLFRNLASMDVEESIRGNPIDGVVLLAGCDKTTPSLLMGAASCDLPTIVVSGGPMLNGRHRGRVLGSGTDVWKFADEVRAGTISEREFMDAEAGMSRSAGHCMTMGTASTMASLALAFATDAAMPGIAFFTCRQRHPPKLFWKPDYQHHRNGALRVVEVVMSAPEPAAHRGFLERMTESAAELAPGRLTIGATDNRITVLSPFEISRRLPGLAADGSPRFRAARLAVADLDATKRELQRNGVDFQVNDGVLSTPPAASHGLALEFVEQGNI